MAGLQAAIQIRGVREFMRTLDRADAAIKQRVARAVAFTAQEVANGARARVSIRTGELRNTIRAEPTTSPMRWVVAAGFGRMRRRRRSRAGSSKKRRVRVTAIEPRGVYAAIVEFGSHGGRARQPAQPFLFPAVHASQSRHAARIARAMNEGAAAASRGAK
jgi:hypothetical protein